MHIHKQITIDPSIAVELDIDRVAHSEHVEIRFNADADWTGTFELIVYNSAAKNSFVKPANALTVAAKVMTWVIEPLAQGLTDRLHYYEIVETQSKRIIFRGQLKITK
jgi:hypothetical protein